MRHIDHSPTFYIVISKYYGVEWYDMVCYVIGACRNFGIILTEEEANVIMRYYDRKGNGTVEYSRIADDMMEGVHTYGC